MSRFELTAASGSLRIPHVGSRLVAYLALQQRPVSRAMVAGVLWPETTEDKAQASLRSALWRVRRVCEHLVEAAHDCLALTDSVTVDVDSLLETSCRPDPHPDDPACSTEAIDGAVPVSWFACELLPGWYDDWVIFERERFRLAALHALDRISADHRSRGDHGLAAEYALMAIRLEPLRESSRRALIETHLAQGNLSEAVRQFQTYRHLLGNELGVEPTALMTDLIEAVGLSVDWV